MIKIGLMIQHLNRCPGGLLSGIIYKNRAYTNLMIQHLNRCPGGLFSGIIYKKGHRSHDTVLLKGIQIIT